MCIRDSVRPCVHGEIKKEDQSCVKCESGTYSILDPMDTSNGLFDCKSCVANADCYGGTLIVPRFGYWRHHELSTVIGVCPLPISCIGPANNTVWQSDCRYGHKGTMCFACIKYWAKASEKNPCDECDYSIFNYVKLGATILFFFIYIFYQVVKSFDGAITDDVILIKLLQEHIQLSTIIYSIDLGWPKTLSDVNQAQKSVAVGSDGFFSIDCITQLIFEDVYMMKVSFAILSPILLGIISTLLWYLVKFALKKIFDFSITLRENILATVIMIYFMVYPDIVNKTISLFNCRVIDDYRNIAVLQMNPDVVCYGEYHHCLLYTSPSPRDQA
eukprot:TRINITY_DN11410_c0_g1_i2.p1 TRINITY_DN11410_c0_g1~~TRINITY_DN11410_c0_g1_i2.p1  ORF type:complete len:349 (+),score=90.16 TRINITY_DN11410_c0_g1_i2:60-1049(+)